MTCCHLDGEKECENPARWNVYSAPYGHYEDLITACDKHLVALLDDSTEHKIYPIACNQETPKERLDRLQGELTKQGVRSVYFATGLNIVGENIDEIATETAEIIEAMLDGRVKDLPPFNDSVTAAARRYHAILKAVDAGEVALVPVEPTQAMMDATGPAFARINDCVIISAIHGFEVRWEDGKPPFYRAFKDAVLAAGRHSLLTNRS